MLVLARYINKHRPIMQPRNKLLTLEKQLQQIHISPAQINRGHLVTRVPILAPIGGTVGHIMLSVGTYTDASSPIMEIVNNSTIYADLLVYEKDIHKIKPGQKVSFTLNNQDNKQVSGTVYGINKSFEGENKAVIVHAVINNVAHLNLIPGMFVSALIEVGRQVVSAVPKDAIVKATDKQYIFVLEEVKQDTLNKEEVKPGGKIELQKVYVFKKVEVVTGVEELGYVEIKLLEELPPNKKIVTKGAFYIYSKMQNIDTDDLL
jgi:membrane fusion protein, heavy metal efflux system